VVSVQNSGSSVETLTVGLESWVIQDGNYPEFVTGQRSEFALELYAADGLRRTDPVDQPGCRLIADSTYEVGAEVVHADRHALVLSFGLLSYSIHMIDVPGRRLRAGDWVAGGINLSVDPFFYFEELAKRRRLPPLIYAWRVHEVLQRTAPLVLANPGDIPGDPVAEQAMAEGTLHIRDPSQHGWETIAKTDAWQDDDGNANYLLRCRREAEPAATSRSV
jgi:hypothetical protein